MSEGGFIMDFRSMELAHDLKTPIQLIYSCVQMIEMECLPNARAEKYIRMLTQSADQLQGMVLNALRPQTEDVCDIAACARMLAEQIGQLCADAGIRFAFHTNADSLRMYADGEKIERILQNLAANAIRFTPKGGAIMLEMRAMNDFVELSVADTGCGIAPEDRERVFEAGVTNGGTGIGLYEAQAFAGSMDGKILLESEIGTGSRFTLRLPVRGA